MNILNTVKENFGNPSDKWNKMDNTQKVSMIMSFFFGVVLLGLVLFKKVRGIDYLSGTISKLTPDGFISLLGALYIILGGLQLF